MRGRDGGCGDVGRDIGGWSVAINGNLSCYGDGDCKRAARGRRASSSAWPWACAGLKRAAGARRLDGTAVVVPSNGRGGVEAEGRHPPLAAGARVGKRAAGPGETQR